MSASKVNKGNFDFMQTLSILMFNGLDFNVFINWGIKRLLFRFAVLVCRAAQFGQNVLIYRLYNDDK